MNITFKEKSAKEKRCKLKFVQKKGNTRYIYLPEP